MLTKIRRGPCTPHLEGLASYRTREREREMRRSEAIPAACLPPAQLLATTHLKFCPHSSPGLHVATTACIPLGHRYYPDGILYTVDIRIEKFLLRKVSSHWRPTQRHYKSRRLSWSESRPYTFPLDFAEGDGGHAGTRAWLELSRENICHTTWATWRSPLPSNCVKSGEMPTSKFIDTTLASGWSYHTY